MAEIEVFCDVRCELGESPAAHPASGRAFWFDITGKRLLERAIDGGGRTIVHELPWMASILASIDDERQLIASEIGLHIRDMRSGALTDYMPVEADNPATRANDGRVHPCGAFWFGTMGKHAEEGAGSVYWFFKGELRKLYGGISIINATCFAPDGSAAYFADSAKGTIWRVETDPATGLPIGEPTIFVTFPASEGVPDGAVTDANGWVWNARWGGSAIDAYDASGRRVRSIAMPARQVSCPVFLGSDRLLVTSATQGMDEAAMAKEPFAGKTFWMRLDVAGRFDPPVAMG